MSENNNNEEPKSLFSAIGDTIKSAAHLAVEAVVGIERAILPEFDLDNKDESKEQETQEGSSSSTPAIKIENKEDYKQGFKADETPKPLLPAIFHQPISETARQAVEKVRETVLPRNPENEPRSDDYKPSLEEKPLPLGESSSKDTVEGLISEARKKKNDKTLSEQGKAQIEKKQVSEKVQEEQERIAEITHEVVERAKHNKEFMEAVLLAEDPLKLIDKDVHKINLSTTVDHKEHAHPHDIPSR